MRGVYSLAFLTAAFLMIPQLIPTESGAETSLESLSFALAPSLPVVGPPPRSRAHTAS